MEVPDNDILADVSQEHSFITKSGKVIRNLQELHNSVKNMDDDEFRHHVNDHRNDFHNWVRDVHEDGKLAGRLREAKTKHQVARHIKRRIKEHKKQSEVAKDVKAIIKTEKINAEKIKAGKKEAETKESSVKKEEASIEAAKGNREEKKRAKLPKRTEDVFVDNPPAHKHHPSERQSNGEKNHIFMKQRVMEFITGLLFGAVSLLILKSMA